MNNNRRERINKVHAKLDEILGLIDELREEEQEAYDNMPESMQYGERGEKMQEAIDALEEAYNDVEEACDNLDTAAE